MNLTESKPRLSTKIDNREADLISWFFVVSLVFIDKTPQFTPRVIAITM